MRGGQVATGPDGAPSRDDRQDPTSRHASSSSTSHPWAHRNASRARSRVTASPPVQPRADRVPDPAGVAAQQTQLQLLGQLLGDRLGHEAAEARVDAVGVLARAVRGAVDDCPRRVHARARRVGERRVGVLHRNRPDVLDGQVLTGEPDRRAWGHGGESSQPRASTRHVRPGHRHSRASERELRTPPRPRRLGGCCAGATSASLSLAVSISEIGDALSYIALMWFALEAGGALGVVAVRLADSVPGLFFGLHGGIAADRWSRREADGGRRPRPAATLSRSRSPGFGALPIWASSSRRSCSRPRRATSSRPTAPRPRVVEREERPAGERTRPGDGGRSRSAAGRSPPAPPFCRLSAFFAANAATFLGLGPAALPPERGGRPSESPHVRQGIRRAAAAADPGARGGRVRRRGDDHGRHLDRRVPTSCATPRPRPGRLLARDDRLRGRVRSAAAASSPVGLRRRRAGASSRGRSTCLPTA